MGGVRFHSDFYSHVFKGTTLVFARCNEEKSSTKLSLFKGAEASIMTESRAAKKELFFVHKSHASLNVFFSHIPGFPWLCSAMTLSGDPDLAWNPPPPAFDLPPPPAPDVDWRHDCATANSQQHQHQDDLQSCDIFAVRKRSIAVYYYHFLALTAAMMPRPRDS